MVNKDEYMEMDALRHIILSGTIETMPKDYCLLDIFAYFVSLLVSVGYCTVIASMFMVN